MLPNEVTHQVMVGNVPVGGGAPCAVQSMLNLPLSEVEENLAQIERVAQAGCDIIRIAIPHATDLDYFEQICAQIEHNEIDLVIFLRDPMTPKMHEPTVNNILRLCDMHNIPVATNLATSELLIKSLDRGDLDWREMYK